MTHEQSDTDSKNCAFSVREQNTTKSLMQTTKSSEYVSHSSRRLFEIQLWAMSYRMHELNLFKQLTRMGRIISINKSRIEAYFRTNVHKYEFHPVFRI